MFIYISKKVKDGIRIYGRLKKRRARVRPSPWNNSTFTLIRAQADIASLSPVGFFRNPLMGIKHLGCRNQSHILLCAIIVLSCILFYGCIPTGTAGSMPSWKSFESLTVKYLNGGFTT